MKGIAIGYVVFARHDSRRLPGKALRDLAGRSLLARVLDRIRAAAQGRPVVVATSDRPIDDGIARLADAEGVGVFRGAAEDVAGRALACARANELDAFVRICGDSPFIDPVLCRQMVDLAEAEPVDLITNLHPRTYPPGCSVEVVATGAIARLCASTDQPGHREHVTTWFYENDGQFIIRNVTAPRPLPAVRLAVDTEEDLERACGVFAAAGGSIDGMGSSEIIALYQRLYEDRA